MINMNDFMKMIIKISGKNLTIKNTPFHGVGVRGRNSDNKLIEEKLGWKPNYPLEKGIKITYNWINEQYMTIIKITKNKNKNPHTGLTRKEAFNLEKNCLTILNS